MIRQATEKDIDAIAATYEELFDREDAEGTTTNWRRGDYPTRKVPEEFVPKGAMWVLEDEGRICASMLLNHAQGPGYDTADWEVPARDDQVLVIHTLVVSPSAARKGYGSQRLAFAEDWGRENGCVSCRIDTWIDNEPAKAFYLRHGYRISGSAHVLHWGVIDEEQVFLEKKL